MRIANRTESKPTRSPMTFRTPPVAGSIALDQLAMPTFS